MSKTKTVHHKGIINNEVSIDYYILGVYINYYRDGNDWTPNHSHPKQVQLIISLGATRTLTIGKKDYLMESGDVAIFGSSIHGIRKEPEVKEGRISIATFMLRK
jgi:hypothetical protein